MTHTPQDRDQQIAAMLRDGATYAQIMSKLRASTTTIRRVRQTHDIPVPPGRAGARPITDEQRAASAEQRHPQAAAMLRAGHTHRDIAEACGIGTGTVSDIRRALNIPIPPGRPGPKGPRRNLSGQRRALDDQIADLLTAGHTYDHIRTELHVGPARITRVRNERAITPPTRTRKSPQPAAAQETPTTPPDAHTRADQMFEQIFGGAL